MTFKLEQGGNRDGPVSEEDINLHIGRRIRRRRRLLGLTQHQVGSGLRLKFQQVQKYECAANRVSASRLYLLANTLQVPIQYFFDGLPQAGQGAPANDHEQLDSEELMASKEARELVGAFFRLPESIRRRLRDFAKALSENHTRVD